MSAANISHAAGVFHCAEGASGALCNFCGYGVFYGGLDEGFDVHFLF